MTSDYALPFDVVTVEYPRPKLRDMTPAQLWALARLQAPEGCVVDGVMIVGDRLCIHGFYKPTTPPQG